MKDRPEYIASLKGKNNKKIDVYDKNWKFIKTYNSVWELAEKFWVGMSSISKKISEVEDSVYRKQFIFKPHWRWLIKKY
jgi:hypothetical protein